MPTILKAEHKKHLAFLTEQSSQVLRYFCKLATEYLEKGPSPRVYETAAQELRLEPEVIKISVEALINLLLEFGKSRSSEENVRDFVSSIGFDEEKTILLAKLWELEKSSIDLALKEIGSKFPHYHDMEWRFQVQLASRSLLSQLTPIFTIDLMLKKSKNTEKIDHILLQSDPTNLMKLAQELESAIGDARTQHIRRIKRSVK